MALSILLVRRLRAQEKLTAGSRKSCLGLSLLTRARWLFASVSLAEYD